MAKHFPWLYRRLSPRQYLRPQIWNCTGLFICCYWSSFAEYGKGFRNLFDFGFIPKCTVNQVLFSKLPILSRMTVSFCSEVDFEPCKGAFLGMIELCYFGRFIFGCGGETLSVAQKGFIAQWFDQKSLNFVLGLQLSFARIGEYKLILIVNPYWKILRNSSSVI